VARLAARVDSLAVAVTAMKAIIDNGSAGTAQQPETATVATAGAGYLGRKDAPVTVVEFTDYQCPFCARHARETLPKLKQEYVNTGRVRYIVRDLPLPSHELAPRLAQAARCAGSQGSDAYWRYHDALFASQTSIADSSFPSMARKAGVDPVRLDQCMESNAMAALVQKDRQEAEKAGLSETPSFVIGRTSAGGMVTGTVIRGAYPYEQFKATIDAAVKAGADLASE
jgi:protein-disulfide isomerase